MMTSRNDTRYTQQTPENGLTYGADEQRPVLRAWGGEDATLPMGGWMDEDAEAFLAAVQDEARYGAGEELSSVVIERVSYDEDGEVIGGEVVERPFVGAGAAQS